MADLDNKESLVSKTKSCRKLRTTSPQSINQQTFISQ